jgi:hypothetical protein
VIEKRGEGGGDAGPGPIPAVAVQVRENEALCLCQTFPEGGITAGDVVVMVVAGLVTRELLRAIGALTAGLSR